MAQLYYVGSASGWNGYVTVNFTAVYDPVTNATTVTFSQSSHKYYGRNGYGSNATTALTVTANDSGNSASATLATEGSTNGGEKTFTGTPSPTTVTVQHAAGSGVKSITIAGSTTFYATLSSTATSQSYAYGSGSTTITMATAYTLDIAAGEGATVDVERTASSVAATGAVADGAMLYAGDVLEITYSTEPEYEVSSATVNGSAITSGTSHTVSADVAVIIATELSGILHVGDKVGSVCIAKDGQWHRGVTCAAEGGTWHPGC